MKLTGSSAGYAQLKSPSDQPIDLVLILNRTVYRSVSTPERIMELVPILCLHLDKRGENRKCTYLVLMQRLANC